MLGKLFFLLPAVLAAASCGKSIPQEQLESRAAEAVRLFEEVCVGSNGSLPQIAAQAEREQWLELGKKAVQNLPLGMMELDAQTVWRIEQNGTAFYVSTAPDSCSVKTARADHQTARKHFTGLAEKGHSGAESRLRADHSVSSPFPFSQLVYGRYENGAAEEVLLTANTSPSEHVPAQLALYFTRRPVKITADGNP